MFVQCFFKLARSEFHEDGPETEKERGLKVIFRVLGMWRCARPNGVGEDAACPTMASSSRVTGVAGYHRRASVAGSHGPAKPAFCRYRQGKLVIL